MLGYSVLDAPQQNSSFPDTWFLKKCIKIDMGEMYLYDNSSLHFELKYLSTNDPKWVA